MSLFASTFLLIPSAAVSSDMKNVWPAMVTFRPVPRVLHLSHIDSARFLMNRSPHRPHFAGLIFFW
jgi:hypothetical protein